MPATIQLQAALSGNDAVVAGLKRLEAGLAGVTQNVKNIALGAAAPLAALASVGGFISVMNAGLRSVTELAGGARLAGVSIQEMSGIVYATKKPVEEIEQSLRTFSNYLTETGQGSRNLKDALLEQADIFNRLPDGAEKNSLAIQRFGRSGLEMVSALSKGREELERQIEVGQRLYGVTDRDAKIAKEFKAATNSVAVAAESLGRALAVAVLPALTDVLKMLTEGVTRLREAADRSVGLKLALEGVAVAAGVLAAYKLGGVLTSGLSFVVGAGTITSLKDFVAALGLIPNAAALALRALAPIALAVTGITTALMAGIELRRLLGAKITEEKSAANASGVNADLADTILRTVEAKVKAGALAAEEGVQIRLKVSAALDQKDVDAVRMQLKEIAAPLLAQNPAAARVWTQLGLEAEQKKIDLQIKLAALEAEELSVKKYSWEVDEQVELMRASLLLIDTKRADAQEALAQKAISQLQYDEIDVKLREQALGVTGKILALEGKRQENFIKANSERLKQQLETDQKLGEFYQNDARLTNVQKRALAITNLRAQLRDIEAAIDDIDKRLLDPNLAAPLREQMEGYRGDLESKRQGTTADLAFKQGSSDPNSVLDQLGEKFASLMDSAGTGASRLANLFTNTLSTAIDSFSGEMTNAIIQTGNWGKALQNIGTTVLTQLTNAIIKMFLQRIVMDNLATAFGITNRQREGAEEKKLGLQKAFTYAVSAAKSVADIPYIGWILAPAVFAGVLAAAIAASSIGGFAEGGVIPGNGGPKDDNIIARVSAGEGIINARAVMYYGGASFIDAINSLSLPQRDGVQFENAANSLSMPASGGLALAVNSMSSPSLPPVNFTSNPNVNVAPTPVSVIVVNNQEELLRLLESRAGEGIVLKHIGNNRPQIGLRS